MFDDENINLGLNDEFRGVAYLPIVQFIQKMDENWRLTPQTSIYAYNVQPGFFHGFGHVIAAFAEMLPDKDGEDCPVSSLPRYQGHVDIEHLVMAIDLVMAFIREDIDGIWKQFDHEPESFDAIKAALTKAVTNTCNNKNVRGDVDGVSTQYNYYQEMKRQGQVGAFYLGQIQEPPETIDTIRQRFDFNDKIIYAMARRTADERGEKLVYDEGATYVAHGKLQILDYTSTFLDSPRAQIMIERAAWVVYAFKDHIRGKPSEEAALDDKATLDVYNAMLKCPNVGLLNPRFEQEFGL